MFEYVKQFYGVSPSLGQRVMVSGNPGTIAEDRGHYIGVNFDTDKPGVIKNVHPTSNVVYQPEIVKVRGMTRAQRQYQRFLAADWYDGSFGQWLKDGYCNMQDGERRGDDT
jgi:hypothetical protein